MIPGRKDAGRNTAVSTSVTPSTGPVSSFIAVMAASFGVRPSSMWRDAFSTMTIASSTTMPMARIRANSVIRLSVKPRSAMAANAPMIVTGTVVAGTSIARAFWRNRMMTISTRMPASMRVW